MSGWALAVALATIIGVPIAISGLIYIARGQAREQAEKRSNEMQDKYNRGVIDGKASIAPDVNLMRSERDDARRERDRETVRADRAERRIEELEDQLRGTH